MEIITFKCVCLLFLFSTVSCEMTADYVYMVLSSKLDSLFIDSAMFRQNLNKVTLQLDKLDQTLKEVEDRQKVIVAANEASKEKVADNEVDDTDTTGFIQIVKEALKKEKYYIRDIEEKFEKRFNMLESGQGLIPNNDIGRVLKPAKADKKYDQDITSLRSRLDKLEREAIVEQPTDGKDRKVSFSTRLTDNIQILKNKDSIRYNKVIINDGHGYDNGTGIFTAPTSGVYMFSFFIQAAYVSTEIFAGHVSLRVDGEYKSEAIVEAVEHGHDVMGGNVVVVRVQAGQKVWIETVGINGPYNVFPFRTTFCGALLY